MIKKFEFMIDPIQILRYSSKILEIVDSQDQFTRGDFQGLIEAVVMNIVREAEAAGRLSVKEGK